MPTDKKKILLIPGEVWGNMKVISEAPPDFNRQRRVHVECLNCGAKVEIYVRSLVNNPQYCIKCRKYRPSKYTTENMAGKKFGMLTIKKIVFEKGNRYAVCDCDCGTKDVKKKIYGIVNGTIRSCGCMLRENKPKLNKKKKVKINPNLKNGVICKGCGVFFVKEHGKPVYCKDCVKFLSMKGALPKKYTVAWHRELGD